MLDRGRVVIVDVYSPTRRLAPSFAAAGYECVRVQSTPEVPSVYREAPVPRADFVDDIIVGDDIAATISRVAAHRPVAVVAGGESGVELTDLLSSELGLASNGVRLSAARRDKFAMVDALARAGVPGPRQLLVESPEAVRRWHAELGRRVVLKPLRSAASVGVTYCDTPEESARAYTALMAQDSVFSEPNTGVVAQEYLAGPEYMVDTVSCDGLHRVCDMWLNTKISLNGVRDLVDGLFIVPRRGERQDVVVEYACQVLDALEIRHGFAHIEIKIGPEGPRLIDIGARMAGGDIPHYARRALGSSQLDWGVQAFCDPEWFKRHYAEEYEIDQYFATVPMLSPYDGILTGYRGLDTITGLESFDELLFAVRPGERIRRTVDDPSIPMAVNLCHPFSEIVHRDARTLRYLDGAGLYDVKGAGVEGAGVEGAGVEGAGGGA